MCMVLTATDMCRIPDSYTCVIQRVRYLTATGRCTLACRMPDSYDDVVLVGEEEAPFGALAGLPGSLANISWRTQKL
jgi:hypothetical protein